MDMADYILLHTILLVILTKFSRMNKVRVFIVMNGHGLFYIMVYTL